MKNKSLGFTFALMLTAAPMWAQNNDQVLVRLIHAVPAAPAVSVSVGTTQLFDNVAFNKITPWKSMPAQDDKTITLTLADGRTLKTTEQLNFDDDDEQYTILVTPDNAGANPKVVILESDMDDEMDQDEVEVTLINADPARKSIKLLMNDDTEARGVNYAEADDNDVEPGQYTIKIVDAEGVDQIIATKSASLAGGTAVTVLVTANNSVQVVNDAAPDTDLASGAGAAMTAGTATTTGTHMMAGNTTGPHMMPHGTMMPNVTPTTQMDSQMTSPALPM